MRAWVEHMCRFIVDDRMPRDTYGDWCVPPENPKLIHSNDPARKTNGELIGTAYFHHILQLMSRYATMAGKPEDAARYAAMAERMKAAFNKRFFNAEAARYDNGTQTSSLLPLSFGLAPQEQRARLFAQLVAKIEGQSKSHVGTGLVGVQHLMRVLSDNGRPDLALRIATQKDYPGWGYMVGKGATTIWELWNGDTADPAMNSGNHVMLIGDLLPWMYEYLAGIRPDPSAPGYRRIVLKPVPLAGIDFVRAWRADHGRPHREPMASREGTTAVGHLDPDRRHGHRIRSRCGFRQGDGERQAGGRGGRREVPAAGGRRGDLRGAVGKVQLPREPVIRVIVHPKSCTIRPAAGQAYWGRIT